METNKLICTYEERVSKSNSTYKCLVIKLSDKYEKIVFLSVPEQALIERYLQENSSINDYEL